MPTVYTPTKSNLAHAAAKTFRAGLAAAVTAGVTASTLTEAMLNDYIAGNPGDAARLLAASELDLSDAMLVYNALVSVAANNTDAGVVAFDAEITTALNGIANLSPP